MEKYSQVIFDKNTVEFVTVAAEYCGFLERTRDAKRGTFVDTALKILPLLYLKASMIPPCERIGEFDPETFVTEEDYELIRMAVAEVLGSKDDYLEVFPLGPNETMNDSLVICKEHFEEFWGQRLVNTMRALHDVKYNSADEDKEDVMDEDDSEMEDENRLL